MLFDVQAAYAFLAKFRYIARPVGYIQYPFIKPVLEALRGSRASMILMVKQVIAVIIAGHGGRMRSPGFMHDSPHFERWSQHAVRVAQNNITRHDFFGYQDDITSSKHSLLGYTGVAPEMSIAIFVAALHVDDGYVWIHSRHEQQWSAVQRRFLLAERRVLTRDIAAQ